MDLVRFYETIKPNTGYQPYKVRGALTAAHCSVGDTCGVDGIVDHCGVNFPQGAWEVGGS